MKAKAKKKTFAQRAKDIERQFPRAKNDPIEKRDFEEAMEALMEEQEATRESMGISDEAEEYCSGGRIKRPWGGPAERKSWDILGKSTDWLGEQYQQYSPEWLQTGIGAIGNALNYIDTGGNVLPGSFSDEIVSGIAPVAGKTYTPRISTFGKYNKEALASTLKAAEQNVNKAMTKEVLESSVGSPVGRRYKLGNLNTPRTEGIPTNYQVIKGKVYEVPNTASTSNISKDLLKASPYPIAAGIGLLGALKGIDSLPSNSNNNLLIQSIANSQGEYQLPTGNFQLGNRESILPSYMDTLSSFVPPKQGNTQANTTKFTPSNKELLYRTNNNSLTNKLKYAAGFDNIKDITAPKLDTSLETSKLKSYAKSQKEKADIMSNLNNSSTSKFSQYLPLIGGATTAIGNLLLADKAKKLAERNKVTPTYATPEKINLEPKADLLRSEASVAKNIADRNARNIGANPGAVLSNVASAGIDRNLGNALTNLYLGQEQYNVGASNQFALANQEATNRTNLYNSQLAQQGIENQLGYTGAALTAIPQTIRDILAQKQQQQTMDWWNNYLMSLPRNYEYTSSPIQGGKLKVRK